MILLSNVKNKRKIIILFLCFFICACDSQKGKIQEAISQLLLKPMEIPYGQMKCLTNDSLLEISPWKTAKLKLVHYVDSATCSTCFLKKITTYDQLFRLEEDYNNTFINVFGFISALLAKSWYDIVFDKKETPSYEPEPICGSQSTKCVTKNLSGLRDSV